MAVTLAVIGAMTVSTGLCICDCDYGAEAFAVTGAIIVTADLYSCDCGCACDGRCDCACRTLWLLL